jgi:hypothetical protein
VALLPLVRFADVDEERGFGRLVALVRFEGRDLVDLVLHACEQLSVTGHYFPNYSGRSPAGRTRL